MSNSCLGSSIHPATGQQSQQRFPNCLFHGHHLHPCQKLIKRLLRCPNRSKAMTLIYLWFGGGNYYPSYFAPRNSVHKRCEVMKKDNPYSPGSTLTSYCQNNPRTKAPLTVELRASLWYSFHSLTYQEFPHISWSFYIPFTSWVWFGLTVNLALTQFNNCIT